MLVVHPSVPAKTVKELVELMRGSDGKYHGYAHPGLGTPAHLSGELFRLSQKLNLTAIPFGGGGPMIQSVVAGHTPIAFSSLPPAAAQIQAGNVCARSPSPPRSAIESLPDVPTMAEAGYPGQTGETPIGILAPTGTPQGDRRSPAPQGGAIVAQPDVKQKLATHRLRRRSAITPAEFAAFAQGRGREVGQGDPRRPASETRGATSRRQAQPRALEPRQHLGAEDTAARRRS